MASVTEKDHVQNKSSFVHEFLKENPTSSSTEVSAAWTAAGRAGSISPALVSKRRASLGLSGTAQGRPAKSAAQAPAQGPGQAGRRPRSGSAQGKSTFIKELLVDNPQATARDVNRAWTSAGMTGSISRSLVGRLRSELGLTGKIKDRTPSAGTRGRKVRGKAPRPGDRERCLADIEGDIDRLIFKLMVVGGLEAIEDELRQVRRRLVRSQEA
jgi:hypothetical protein